MQIYGGRYNLGATKVSAKSIRHTSDENDSLQRDIKKQHDYEKHLKRKCQGVKTSSLWKRLELNTRIIECLLWTWS